MIFLRFMLKSEINMDILLVVRVYIKNCMFFMLDYFLGGGVIY